MKSQQEGDTTTIIRHTPLGDLVERHRRDPDHLGLCGVRVQGLWRMSRSSSRCNTSRLTWTHRPSSAGSREIGEEGMVLSRPVECGDAARADAQPRGFLSVVGRLPRPDVELDEHGVDGVSTIGSTASARPGWTRFALSAGSMPAFSWVRADSMRWSWSRTGTRDHHPLPRRHRLLPQPRPDDGLSHPLRDIGMDALDPLEAPPWGDADLTCRSRAVRREASRLWAIWTIWRSWTSWTQTAVVRMALERLEPAGDRGFILGGTASGTYTQRARSQLHRDCRCSSQSVFRPLLGWVPLGEASRNTVIGRIIHGLCRNQTKEQADYMRRLAFIALLAVVAAIFLAGCGPKVEGVPGTVAEVNGNGISSEVYLSELHRKMGQQALKALIEREILLSWAKKEKVAPTSAQVDKYIGVLKERMLYDQLAETLGENGLRADVEGRQARVNLSKKMFKVTDEELEGQYERMKPNYVHGPRKFVAVVIGLDKKWIETAAKKIKGGMDFDEVAQLYSLSKAPIKTWIDVGRSDLPAELVDVVKADQGRQGEQGLHAPRTYVAGQLWYLTVLKSEGKGEKTLDDVKAEVADEVALRKTEMDMTDPGFPFQKEATDFEKKFTDAKKKAKIEIDIPGYRGCDPGLPSGSDADDVWHAARRPPRTGSWTSVS